MIEKKSYIPALLNGQDFLASSHYKISYDDRFIPGALRSTFQNDYIPLNDRHKPEAALPPRLSNFEHKDEEKINMKATETCIAFPAKQSINDDRRDKYDSLYGTNFKMDSDHRMSTFNTTHEHYYTPKSYGKANSRKISTRNLFPQGDHQVGDEHISHYRETFQGFHREQKHPKKVFAEYSVKKSSLVGDNVRRFVTTHGINFLGSHVLPSKAVPKHTKSSIPEGDREKMKTVYTTMQESFQKNHTLFNEKRKSDPYNELYATNYKMKDEHGKFDHFLSTHAESYTPVSRNIVPRYRRERDRNASDIPEGDTNPLRLFERTNGTVTRSNHKHLDLSAAAIPRVNGAQLRTVSNVQLGEKDLSSFFYNTTCDSTYNAETAPYRRVPTYSKSTVPLHQFGDLQLRSTTWSDFQSYDADRLKLHNAGLANLCKTHFAPPLDKKRYFSTNHDSQYTPKSIQRMNVDSGRLQRSSVPIGTLGTFIEGSHNGWN